MTSDRSLAWKEAGLERARRVFGSDVMRCEECNDSSTRNIIQHHALPRISEWVFGFTINDWWNCTFRHKKCERKDSHDVSATVFQAGRKKCFRLGYEVASLALAELQALAVLEPENAIPIKGVFGVDRYGLLEVFSRIPERDRERIPSCLCSSVIEVLGLPVKTREKKHKNRKTKPERVKESRILNPVRRIRKRGGHGKKVFLRKAAA